jgi:hypothetical protein
LGKGCKERGWNFYESKMKSNQDDEFKALSTQTVVEFRGEVLQAAHVSGPSFDSTAELAETSLYVDRIESNPPAH